MLIGAPKTWYSPTRPFNMQYKLLQVFSPADIDKKFKKLREAKVLAILAFSLFSKTRNVTFFNTNESDPPDGYLMQGSEDEYGVLKILNVEITHYFGQKDETLLDQLKRTKTPITPIYGNDYLIVVELRTDKEINYEEIRDYLNSIGNPFPVWTIRPLQITPDTIAEIIIINPKIEKMEVNIGESADTYIRSKIPKILNIKRIGKPEHVQYKEIKDMPYDKPSWHIEASKILTECAIDPCILDDK
jgi:hypothetical protein